MVPRIADQEYRNLVRTGLILLILVLLVTILIYAKPFLMPLVFAALLAMLLLPLSRWMENKNVPKAIAIIVPILLLILCFAGLIALLSWQASDLAENASQLEKKIMAQYEQLQQFISSKFGISPERQEEIAKKQQPSAPGKVASIVAGIVGGIGGLLANTLLVMVYIFLFLYFRAYIKRFIIRLVRHGQEAKAEAIIHNAQQVTQKYLMGLALMIVGLWIMYSIGFSIVGVEHAIFFAILCGLLEIIPFIGNLIGNSLTVIMVLLQGGGLPMVTGVLITYAIVQFIQSYILEPLVVGRKVNINPLFTIAGLIAGEQIWGIGGMVLAIPVMGVVKIVFDHVESLKPYGEFMGEDQEESSGFKKKANRLGQKVKHLFS